MRTRITVPWVPRTPLEPQANPTSGQVRSRHCMTLHRTTGQSRDAGTCRAARTEPKAAPAHTHREDRHQTRDPQVRPRFSVTSRHVSGAATAAAAAHTPLRSGHPGSTHLCPGGPTGLSSDFLPNARCWHVDPQRRSGRRCAMKCQVSGRLRAPWPARHYRHMIQPHRPPKGCDKQQVATAAHSAGMDAWCVHLVVGG